MRLVVIQGRNYSVHENKQVIAVFVLEDENYLTPEQIEELRLAEYKELA